MSRSSRSRADDIAEAIGKARSSSEILAAAHDHPVADMAYDATLYRLQVIGEAVAAIPKEVLREVPEVPWQNIKGLRNVIAHGYHSINERIITEACGEPLDELEAALPHLRAEIQRHVDGRTQAPIEARRSSGDE